MPTSTEIAESVRATCQRIVDDIAEFACDSSADDVGAALTQLLPEFGTVPDAAGRVAWDWVLGLLGHQLLAVSRARTASEDDSGVQWGEVAEQFRVAEDMLRGSRGRAAQLGLQR